MSTPVRLPGTLRAAAILLAVQAAAVVAVTILLAYAELSATEAEKSTGLGLTGFALVIAALLGLLARGLSKAKRWARDLAVCIELILLAPAYYMIKGDLPWLGVIVGGLAVAAIAMLVMPATNKAIGVQV